MTLRADVADSGLGGSGAALFQEVAKGGRAFVTLTDLRSFARKHFAGSSADKLAEALSDETTVIVGGDGGSVIHATAVEVAGACVDTEGVGTLALPALEAFLASRPGIPAGELGHIWCRIRSAAFE